MTFVFLMIEMVALVAALTFITLRIIKMAVGNGSDDEDSEDD